LGRSGDCEKKEHDHGDPEREHGVVNELGLMCTVADIEWIGANKCREDRSRKCPSRRQVLGR
jgi:hypothetical protein